MVVEEEEEEEKAEERRRPCAAALIAEAEVGMYVSECSFYTRPDALTPLTHTASLICIQGKLQHDV
ncbi:hypothetical protein V1477_002731 [Vespula maculifrons]|uniref:Uncharacterized protein n=1 Tax=Vespula maculifrons TaxID=7453 RepID=A0ABD2CVJ8_VESMC